MALQIDAQYPPPANNVRTNTAKTDSTVVNINFVSKDSMPSQNSHLKKLKTPIPQEIDKQLQITYKTGIADLQNLPFWLKALGGNKVKNEFIKVVENEKFQKEMIKIMTDAKAKSTKPNKDVIELVKEPGVIDKVFKSLQDNSKKGTLLHAILRFKIVKENFSENIHKNQHKYLLYGE